MEKDLISEYAKGIAVLCVRNNTSLENIHATKGSPLDDQAMKQLMIEIVNNLYWVLGCLYSDKQENMEELLLLQAKKYTREWNDAEIPEWVTELAKILKEREDSKYGQKSDN